MDTRTNLTWPEDPYRTGQQLYRRPAPRLAAFALDHDGTMPAAAAIVYLPMHRTQAVSVTGQTLMFGFRAAVADTEADAADMAKIADLDLMQARRHAAILAGHLLAPQLALLRRWTGPDGLRGLESVEHDWAARDPAPGRARMFDSGLDLPGGPSFDDAARTAGIADSPVTGGQPSLRAVARALTIALICARHLGRYHWAGTLDIAEVVASAAWDCLPHVCSGDRG